MQITLNMQKLDIIVTNACRLLDFVRLEHGHLVMVCRPVTNACRLLDFVRRQFMPLLEVDGLLLSPMPVGSWILSDCLLITL